MWGLTTVQKYYLYDGVTDMRRSFDALSGMVRAEFGQEPMDGTVYIFINRLRNQVKLLVWDRSGYLLYHKRLERGTFERIKMSVDGTGFITWTQLTMVLEGVSIKNLIHRPRYAHL